MEVNFRWLGCFAILGLLTVAFGDTFPANCAMRPLCSDLRTRYPTVDETYTVESGNFPEGFLVFNLSNALGNKLTLTVKKVVNDTFRVTIEEPDLHRYHIQYSLEKEPVIETFATISPGNTSTIASDVSNNTVVVEHHPLRIEFYHEEILQTVLDGSRLIMNNAENDQAFTFRVEFPAAKRLLGLHEHAATVSLIHTADFTVDPYRFKNVDHGKYELNSTQALYGTVPLIYSFGNQSSGIFLHNAAEMWVDVNNSGASHSAYFMVNSGVLDLFVLNGPSLPDTVKQFTDLTGKPHLPQLWTLGYHQSRYGYKTEEDVKTVIQKYDEYDIPLDAVWLDLDYTLGCRWFTWNATEFPDPVRLLDWVKDQSNRKMVVISDSHIKVDSDYTVYSACLQNNYFINNSENTAAFVSTCWPGDSSWIDFLNPDARTYYAGLHSYANFASTPSLGGFWNDMNEPASFNDADERSIPFETLHYQGVRHGDVHNMYGFLQVIATHQGLMERDNGTVRPFILTRSAFAGSQRYTAKWAGDTGGSYDYLRSLVPMTILSNLAGTVFYGGDIPGFFDDPTDELATRWYQTGAWITFFRAHGDRGTKPREPWTFSNETRDLIRESIETRYLHLPYWYTQFYQHVRTGSPIIRGLFYQYPDEEVTVDINDEFLVGSDILVANVYFSDATSLRVYLPGRNENWFLVTGNSKAVYQGGAWYTIPVDVSFIPVFYRSGSIISRKSAVAKSTSLLQDIGHTFHMVLDQDGYGKTYLYIDDYESFDYLNEKKYMYLDISYNHTSRVMHFVVLDPDSNSSGFFISIEGVTTYIDNGNGTYSSLALTEAHDGTPLKQYKIQGSTSIKLH